MFKELFTEAKTERAIFEVQGASSMDDMFNLVEREDQTFVRVDDIQEYPGDSKGVWMLHFLGEARKDSDWMKFAKFIEKNYKKASFERLVP